jgi:hypothetical protein
LPAIPASLAHPAASVTFRAVAGLGMQRLSARKRRGASMIPDQFDTLTKGVPATTRRGVVRTLAGVPLAALLTSGIPHPERARAAAKNGGKGKKKHQSGREGRRRKHQSGGDRTREDGGGGAGSGGAGSGVCPPTCPGGTLTVAPTAQGECRCVPVSPGLKDPAFACGGRVNANGDACCFCLFTVEGDGFCAVNATCETIADASVTECTSSSQCRSGRKCVFYNPNFAATLPAAGFCWPECHTTEDVNPMGPPP